MTTVRLWAEIFRPNGSYVAPQQVEVEIPDDAPVDATIQDLGLRLSRLVRNETESRDKRNPRG